MTKSLGFVLVFLLLFCSCTSNTISSAQLKSIFAEWFVNPSPALEQAIVHAYPTKATFDSSILAIRKGSPIGVQIVTLHDSIAAYSMGCCTPDSLQLTTTYPLIIYLHGGIGSPLSTKGEHAWEMLGALADSIPLFLASPSGNRSCVWWSPYGLQRILQTLRYMTLHYPIDPNKIFLAGVSDGATGCYAAATTIPGPFAGFIAVSGYGGMLMQMGLSLTPSNMIRPIYNINAGNDRLYPISMVKQFTDWLYGNGVNIQVSFHPDEQHGFDYRAEEYSALLAFIHNNSRPLQSRGIQWTYLEGYPNIHPQLMDIVPTRSATLPWTISLYQKADTLFDHSASILRKTYIGPAGLSYLFYKKNGTSAKKLNPCRMSPKSMLRLMQHSQFPFVEEVGVFEIDY